jgi:ADP-ribose pyrophosphatase YjhB (NUDIX family)
MTGTKFLEMAKRLKALTDVGLLYSKNEYDNERYREIQEISLQLLSHISGTEIEDLKATFPAAADYPTAKVDIRGLLLSPDGKLLLVQEQADGRWSLPGGWADVGYTPKEIVVKEFKEETGLDVTPQCLLAVFDKRMHPHPPQPFYVYKFVFLCSATSFVVHKGFDVLDVQYFSINDLPPLSEDRILKSQIELLYEKAKCANADVYVD